MNMLSTPPRPGRALVRADGREAAEDREQLRAWLQTLRSEADILRKQADHINKVAGDAEALAERIERVLRGP